jgi:hypothetical protein
MTRLTRTKAKRVLPLSPLHFARFEFKYVFPANKREEVEHDLLYFLQHDPFALRKPDKKYFVRSLYYDDPVYTAFHDKVDGLHTRSKFRIRTYATAQEERAPCFLEIKGRHNNLVFKHRTAIDDSGLNWEELKGDALAIAVLERAETGNVRDDFEFNLMRRRLQPVALVDYQRRPYLSKYDPNFRVTFDEHLEVTSTAQLFHDGACTTRKMIVGHTVMEVKFHHQLPSWFHRIIQTHELRRVSISKICVGMEVLGLAFDEA